MAYTGPQSAIRIVRLFVHGSARLPLNAGDGKNPQVYLSLAITRPGSCPAHVFLEQQSTPETGSGDGRGEGGGAEEEETKTHYVTVKVEKIASCTAPTSVPFSIRPNGPGGDVKAPVQAPGVDEPVTAFVEVLIFRAGKYRVGNANVTSRVITMSRTVSSWSLTAADDPLTKGEPQFLRLDDMSTPPIFFVQSRAAQAPPTVSRENGKVTVRMDANGLGGDYNLAILRLTPDQPYISMTNGALRFQQTHLLRDGDSLPGVQGLVTGRLEPVAGDEAGGDRGDSDLPFFSEPCATPHLHALVLNVTSVSQCEPSLALVTQSDLDRARSVKWHVGYHARASFSQISAVADGCSGGEAQYAFYSGSACATLKRSDFYRDLGEDEDASTETASDAASAGQRAIFPAMVAGIIIVIVSLAAWLGYRAWMRRQASVQLKAANQGDGEEEEEGNDGPGNGPGGRRFGGRAGLPVIAKMAGLPPSIPSAATSRTGTRTPDTIAPSLRSRMTRGSDRTTDRNTDATTDRSLPKQFGRDLQLSTTKGGGLSPFKLPDT